MKKIIFYWCFILFIASVIYSCKGMYDNLEPYKEENIYPAKFDTIHGKVGFERVEIDLMKVGRVPSSKIHLGKAKKTVVEYDDKRLVIDSVASWLNIENLTLAKLYRFKVYTEDEYGNKSVPQSIALIPYSKEDLKTLVVQNPRVTSSPTAAVLDWPNNLNSILLNYVDMKYQYTDNSGTTHTGSRTVSPRVFAGNLAPGQRVNIEMKYRVVPKVNGIAILDTVELTQPLSFNLPLVNSAFIPAEPSILAANGVTVFTTAGVSNIRKLTFPLTTTSLQDLFYFSTLDEIDLTGGTMFPMTTISYNKNGISQTLGGGTVPDYFRRMGNITNANAQFLVDLLQNNLVKKVKYRPNSLGIDALLAPYVASGQVELVQLEQESYVPTNLFIDGVIESVVWDIDLDTNPTSYPSGVNLKNVVKVVPKDWASSLAIIMPKEYELNLQEYRYLKFKMYAPNKSTFVGQYSTYQRIWPRFMNSLFSFTNETIYGLGLWNTGQNDYTIADSDLEKWVDVTIDLAPTRVNHNRVIVINIGGEAWMVFAPTKDIVFYFSNFRLSKTL